MSSDASAEGAALDAAIAQRLAAIRTRIAQAAGRAHRDPASVRLIAVSKLQSIEAIRSALAAGQRAFGENYAQELREKAEAFGDASAAMPEWHFLGALQTNKAKLVVGRAALVHTCDRLALAKELNKRAAALGAVQRVLIEINLGAESQKAGCDPASLPGLLREVATLGSIRCEGLMCIPPAEGDPRPHFRALSRLREQARDGSWSPHPLDELSMGMSADFELAIEEGATMVRVGTALYGERKKS